MAYKLNKEKIFKVLAIILPVILLIFIEVLGQFAYYLKNNNFLYEMKTSGESGFTIMDKSGLIGFKKNSTVPLKHAKQYSSDLMIDNLGLIHNGKSSRNVSENSFNILFYGGSTVEGRGASSNENTIPALTENCLRRKSTRAIDVYNLGFSGDSTLTEHRRIQNSALKYKPSMVIVLDGRNDFHYGYVYEGVKNNTHISSSELDKIYNEGVSINSILKNLDTYFFQNLVTYKFLSKLIKSFSSEKNYIEDFNIDIEDIYKNYIAFHNSSSAYLDTFDIPFYVFLQPTLGYKKLLSNKEKIMIEESKNTKKKNYNNLLIDFYDLFANSESLNININVNFNLYNISDLFYDENQEVYVDTFHYNDYGNFLISEKICNVIVAND